MTPGEKVTVTCAMSDEDLQEMLIDALCLTVTRGYLPRETMDAVLLAAVRGGLRVSREHMLGAAAENEAVRIELGVTR